MKNNEMIIAFDNVQSLKDWRVTNDGVMGGLSVGNTQLVNKSLIFSGEISIENNGGFTSVFKEIPTLPDKIESISINILGDGNDYQLRVRSQVFDYELSYSVDFNAKKGQRKELTFHFADFKASFRGRSIDNAPLLEPKSISHVGFLMKSKQVKSFSISVQKIKFMGSSICKVQS
jgi:hypothetical protein